jgi:predicted dehydrogenase
MNKPLKTVLIGCGQVAAGYGWDDQYARFYHYATHAQVLAEHPDFNWVAAVDPSEKARAVLGQHWPKVALAPSIAELPDSTGPLEVAVIATPPDIRFELLSELPETIKAILVEKPLGATVAECEEFLARCRKREIQVHVNLWRRSDELHRQLSAFW